MVHATRDRASLESLGDQPLLESHVTHSTNLLSRHVWREQALREVVSHCSQSRCCRATVQTLAVGLYDWWRS